MSSLNPFAKPAAPTVIQASAPGSDVTTPSAMPDKNSFDARRQAATSLAQLSDEGTSSKDTQLTTSKLGDIAKAYRRFGTAGRDTGSTPTIVG